MKPHVEVRNVSKIFGKSPKASINLLKQGKTKKDILKATGQTVGVNNVSFKIYPVRLLSLWVYPEVENPP